MPAERAPNPTAIISYAHTGGGLSEEQAAAHRQRVLRLAAALRSLGIDADLDAYHRDGGRAATGPELLAQRDFVLIVVSKDWKRAWDLHGGQDDHLARQEYPRHCAEIGAIKSLARVGPAGLRERCRLVVLPGSSGNDVPRDLDAVNRYRLAGCGPTDLGALVADLAGGAAGAAGQQLPALAVLPQSLASRPAGDSPSAARSDARSARIEHVRAQLAALPTPLAGDGPDLAWFRLRQQLAADLDVELNSEAGDREREEHEHSEHVHTEFEISSRAREWPMPTIGAPPREAIARQPRHELLRQISEGPDPIAVLFPARPGAGASQLAAAALRAAVHDGAGLTAWITGATRSMLVDGLAAVARALEPVTSKTAEDPEDLARAAREWFGRTATSWLVVVDDLDMGVPGDLLPSGPAGRVIVTTGDRRIHLPDSTRVEVGPFDPAEAAYYVRERMAAPSGQSRLLGDADAETLAAAVGFGPAALAQASAHLLARRDSNVRDYLANLADRARQLAATDRDTYTETASGAAAEKYPSTTAAVALLALDAADTLSGGLATPALELAAVLEPHGAPTAVWMSDAGRTYLARRAARRPGAAVPGAAEAVTPEAARHALRCLDQLGLILYDPSSAGLEVRIGALARRAVTETITHGGATDAGTGRLDELIRAAGEALVQTWPRREHAGGPAATYRNNTAALAAADSTGALHRPDTHGVLYAAGRSLGDAGPPQQAARYFGELLAAQLRALGPDHPDVLATRSNLASWRGQAGDPAGAAAAFQALLPEVLRLLGPDHPHTLATRNNLALWRSQVGDFAGAATGLEELLAGQLRTLGPDHPDTLATYGNLAHLYGEAGNAAGAAAAFRELLNGQLRTLGPGHPATLVTHGNVAHARSEAGDAAGAAEAFQSLLDVQRRMFGPDHPSTLATRGNLAHARGRAGDAAAAVDAFQRLLTDQLRVLGRDHPHILATRSNLALWRGRSGDAARATSTFQELLEDQLQVLGPDHPDTLATRGSLAHLRGESGDAASAAASLRQLLDDEIRALRPGHPHTAATRDSLALWRRRAEQES